MATQDTLSAGFANIVGKAGKPIRVRYFSEVAGSVWDDEVTLTEITGSEDVNLMEQ